MQELGSKLGVFIDVRSKDDYRKLADSLEEKREKAFSIVSENYLDWLDAISKELDLGKSDVARRTFISATCGYGSNNVSALRNFAYSLSRMVAELNRKIA